MNEAETDALMREAPGSNTETVADRFLRTSSTHPR